MARAMARSASSGLGSLCSPDRVIFSLQCANNYLEQRVEDLAGGRTAASLHDELMQARRTIEERDADLASYDSRMASMEDELADRSRRLAHLEAELHRSRESAFAATSAADETLSYVEAEARSRQRAEAEIEVQSAMRAELTRELASERQSTRLLTAALAEAEVEAATGVEKASRGRALESERSVSQARVLSVQERSELEAAAAQSSEEVARLQATAVALQAELQSAAAELSAARQQVAATRNANVSSGARIGTLEVLLQAREARLAELEEATATSDAAHAHALDAARRSAAREVAILHGSTALTRSA